MLHRAASNAYSWWWASHIRTKQSKWLDNNLQDVEVRVENVIKMIEEDGDSFAQKAEMYYRKRPELIKFVEEFYRAYRALAERYDHISGELHKANKTLATVFPDQLHHLSDADDASADKTLAAVFPDEDQKEEETRSPPPAEPPESPEATVNSKEEIEKLLKGILVLQTEKEFIKSCYESSLAKYWEIEGKMTEMQKEVCLLQDRHGVSMAIEDDEARALMAATALKTCEAALVNLQEHQRQAMEEAGLASARIRVSKGKLQTLKSQGEGSVDSVEISGSAEAEVASCLAMAEGRLELQTMCEKMKEHFEKASVEEMAEKIDELAEKIIGLEVKASSQTAQIRHLRNEVEELEKNLERMEEEKAAVGSDGKIGDVEKELLQLQFLESSVKDEGEKLLSDFSVACRSFADISERFQGEGEERLKEEEDVDEALRSSFDHECENFQSGDCGSIHGDQDEDGEERENGIDPSEKIQLKEEEEKRENGIDPSEKMQLKEEEEKENGINPSEKMQLKEEEEEREKGIDPSEKIQLKEEEEERENGIDPSEKMQLKEEEDERENGVDPSEKMQLKEEEEEKGEERENGIDPSENIQLKEEEEERENGIDPSEKLQLKEEEEKRENGIDPSEKIQLKDEEEERGNGIDPSKKMQLKEEEEEEEAGGGPLNWQQMLLVSGLEGREKLLLNEYTSILRNYKETKRRIFEMEKRHQQHISETTVKIRGLMQAAAAKDEEILSLRSKLRSLEFSRCPENEERESSSPPAIPPPDKEEESLEDGAFPAKEIDLQVPEEPESSNAIEESFRREIDGLLEENLEFWLRFSASFQQMQRLQASWKSLQAEILQVGGNGGGGGSGTASSSDASPDFLFKDLGNLQSELLSWLEENTQLKSELQLRFSSLGRIKEEMSRVLAESAGEEESQLTAYRAAKFHGELLSMQQENNKVAEDLRAGLGTAKSVQAEVERAMARLRRSLGVVSPAKTQPHYHFRHFSGKSRIPLKSILLFGAKPKPKKPSLFSCMNPALQKQYSDLSPGLQPRN